MGANESHETYESKNADIKDGRKYSAKFVDNYFAEGKCRYAFKGVLQGDGPRNNSACVTKVFKSEYARNFIKWAPDLAASKRAKGYAEEFAQKYYPKLRNYISGHEIEFLIPLIAKMKNISNFRLLGLFPILKDERYVTLYEHVAIEPFIEGQYKKFNSNHGWEDGMHELMTAFCHWTWNVSGHKYMVCDLQGVKSGNKYILTDPAIHSYNGEFGPTDLGDDGMCQVLGNHQCNHLCRELGLNNPLTGVEVNSGPRSTTYSFQVTEEEMLKAHQMVKYYGMSVIPE